MSGLKIPGRKSGRTVKKADAERALAALQQSDTPRAEQVRAVQAFLDGRDAQALSPGAKAALLDFLAGAGKPSAGVTAVALRGGHKRLQALLSKPARDAGRSKRVAGWLELARQDRQQALAEVKRRAARGGTKLALPGVEKADGAQLRAWLQMPLPE
jgi:hypothetical protein